MGAATTICYDEKSPIPISGVIIDSSFADFKDIARNMVEKMGMSEQTLAMLWP